MTGRLAGKVALITGSARGQGGCEAALFAREGAEVIVSDIADGPGEATAKAVNGTYLRLDVTSTADWAATAEIVHERFGRLDVLLNNAGVAPAQLGRVDELDVQDHLRLFDVNVHGAYYGIRAMLPLLREGHGPSIVNVSSIDGLTGVGFMASYVASKHALTGLTRSLAIDLGPVGIRVNSLHPGVIDTPMVRSIGQARSARLTRTVGRQPLSRMGRPEEIAAMALFLASDESSYCTGAQFTADGGHLAGPYRELPV
ncbi:SDR family oxidoreductase [Streptomyces sp. NBC_01239]|uniref:SDR family NAD(P)-dependent oxidoreductase n=1 Tax=Streptomyces sp. NBC_01239 TaxID=2903792 RepID=UPI002257EA65|nr:glucose 1-dehydrogenase [Streptomyces sp. NBC_01239]MCX4815215.1 SDR family oxidoreductase [Streptomyces sp. NBC_01239]